MCSAQADVRSYPKADMSSATRHVRFVPIADIRHLFDRLIDKQLHRIRDCERQYFPGAENND